jgi:hypothetical protein
MIALDGTARIRPIIKSEGEATTLLLDGAPVRGDVLRVATGPHELRLLQPGLPPHIIEFEVLDRHATEERKGTRRESRPSQWP